MTTNSSLTIRTLITSLCLFIVCGILIMACKDNVTEVSNSQSVSKKKYKIVNAFEIDKNGNRKRIDVSVETGVANAFSQRTKKDFDYYLKSDNEPFVYGYVKSADSDTVLQGASVRELQTQRGTYTNHTGLYGFYLTLDGVDSVLVKASYVGFLPVTAKFKGQPNTSYELDFNLHQANFN